MKVFAYLLFSLLLVASCCLLTLCQVPRRQVTKTLTLSNGLDWGQMGPLEYCPDGSFAKYLEAKFESYSGLDIDETALNALKLYCFTPGEDSDMTAHIMSTEGEKGEWQDMKGCSSGLLTAMKARVLEPQGTLGDDVAMQNVQMECDYGHRVITAVDGARNGPEARIPLGDWGDWSACPHDSAICGIQTRYNEPSAVVDDAGLCDMLMFCCSVDGNTTYTN